MSSAPPPPPAPPRRLPRRRLRFTLRLLLAAITLVCLALGLWTHRAREQRRLVERIAESGGTVYYTYERKTILSTIFLAPSPSQSRISPVPRVLLDSLGIDYFHQIREVNTRDKSVLPELSRFWSLERLAIMDESLTDDDLVPIAGMDSLKRLTINREFPIPGSGPLKPEGATADQPSIGDRSLAMIGQTPSLEYAYIEGYQFTAKGLESLARSTSLQTVYVSNCDDSVDSRVAERFKKSGRVKRICIRRYIPGSGYRDVIEW